MDVGLLALGPRLFVGISFAAQNVAASYRIRPLEDSSQPRQPPWRIPLPLAPEKGFDSARPI